MTNREPPENSNDNHNNDGHLNPARRFLRIVKRHRTPIIVGVTIISMGIVGYRGVRFLVTKVIPTEIEKQLSESLAREVDLGEVTSFSFNHLTIENTSIPPTPQDTSYLEIDEIKIKFNILPALVRRPLPVYITVNELTGLANSNTLTELKKLIFEAEIPETLKLPPLPVALDLKLRLQEAQLAVEPNLETKPLNINAQANIDFLYDHRQQPLNYQLKANLAEGSIEVEGQTLLSTGNSANSLQIKQLYLPEITSLFGDIPLTLEQGELNANLNLNLDLLQELDKSKIDGELSALNLQAKIANDNQQKALEKPLLANASITFKGQKLNLEEVKASWGDFHADVKGTVGLQEGFNLDVNLNSLSVAKVLPTIDLALPVNVDGLVTANLEVKGEISEPVINGKIQSKKTVVDRVLLGDINTNFQANLSEFILQDLTVKPVAGGEITASGAVKTNLKQTLETQGTIDPMSMPLNFNFQADLPIAKIIAPYYNLPDEISISKLLAQGEIKGNLEKPQASVNFEIPQPAASSARQISGSGKLVLADNKFSLTNTKLIVNQGKVAVDGILDLKSRNWQANLAANQITLTPFLAQLCRASDSCPDAQLDLTRPITLENTTIQLNGKLEEVAQTRTKRRKRKAKENLKNINNPAKKQNPLAVLGLDKIQGKAKFSLRVDGGTISVDSNLDKGQIQATVKAKQIPVQNFLPAFPLKTDLVTGNVNIQGAIDELLSIPEKVPSSFNIEADATLAVEGGIINATTNLNSETIEVFASINQVALEEILPFEAVEVEGTQVNISANTKELFALVRQPFELSDLANLNSLNANADLELAVGTGKVNANAKLDANLVQITAVTNNISSQEILPNLPLDIDNVDAQVNLSANLRDLLALGTSYSDNQSIATIPSLRLTADASLEVANGRVSVLANVQNNQWQANINANELNPDILVKQLSLLPVEETLNLPNLSANLNLAGNVNPWLQPNPTLPIEAKSVAINLGENYLSANGNLTIANLFTQPDISNLQLNVQAQSDLATLPINPILAQLRAQNTLLPQAINLTGQADFRGTINGKNILSNPLGKGNLAVKGDLTLANFSFNDAQFEPLLTGTVTIIPDQKIAIDLRGTQDVIAATFIPGSLPIPRTNLTIPYLPELLEIRQGGSEGIMVEGKREGDRFIASIDKFPLELFNIAPGIEYGILGVIQGNVKADLAINLVDFSAAGNITVKEPGIGNIQAQEISSSFSYQDDVVQLETAWLKFGETKYDLEGSLNLSSGDINAKLNLEGDVEDIFAATKLSDLGTLSAILQQIQGENNLASAQAIESVSVGNTNSSLKEKLNLLSQIDQQIKELAAKIEAGTLPNELEIIGKYQGEVIVVGKITNPEVKVNFEGNNWQWLPQQSFPNIVQSLGLVIEETQAIAIPKIFIKGQFKNGQVDIDPFQLNIARSKIYFAGNLSLEQQSGQFKVENFSVDLVKNFVPIPVDIAGEINIEGSLDGSLANPQIGGTVNLTNAALEGKLLEKNIAGEFNYTDYRLKFNTTAPEEIQITAVVPYHPRVKTDEPVEVNVNLDTKAIALLGVLTQGQIGLVGGEAKANVKVQVPSLESLMQNFSLDEINLTGNLTLDQTKITSPNLSEPVYLNGKINLVNKALQVEKLDVTVAKDTQIEIVGALPLFTPIKNNQNPLRVKISEQDLNLEGLYNGRVSGDIIIAGTALTPEIGGEFYLGNGTVGLPSRGGFEKVENIGEWYQWIGAVSEQTASIFQPKLNNFNLNLEGLELVNWQLYRFIFGGNLNVNGNLVEFEDLQAKGAVNLQRGEVYVNETTFFLSRAHDNQIRFEPQQGILNPQVDLQIQADITDYSTQLRLPATQDNEVPDPVSRSGQAEVLRVTLSIDGQAQQLLPALAGDTTQLCGTPFNNPIIGQPSFAEEQARLDRVAKCVKIKAIQAQGSNLEILNSPIVKLSSSPNRSEGRLIELIIGGQLIDLARQLQRLNEQTLFEFGITQFVLTPATQELGFVVNETVSAWGEPVGMKDFRVFPLVEGVYEIQKRNNITVSYDYIFSEFKFRYQLRF